MLDRPIKVFQCVPVFSSLTQTFIYDLIKNLDQLVEIDTHVVTWQRENIHTRPFEKTHQIPQPTRLDLLAIRLARLLPRSLENLIPVTAFERSLRNALRIGDADLVHAHFGPTAVLIARVCRQEGIPLVVSFRGRDASAKLEKWRWRRMYRSAFSNISAAICVSHDLAQRIKSYIPPYTQCEVIPVGKSLDNLEYRLPKKPSGSLISIGRLIEKKGHSDAIRAVSRVRQSGFNVTLTIVGDGPLKDDLQSLITSLGLDDSVTLRGSLPYTEVTQLLSAHDFLIAANKTASNGDREGIPNVIKEAQLTGLPVIGTRHGGIPDAIPSKYRGHLVTEDDVAGLANEIQRMMKLSEEEIESISIAGFRHIRDAFNTENEIRSHAALYSNLVQS